MDCIAVYIDCENISYKDFDYIDHEIRNYGRRIVCNLYADWKCKDMTRWNHVATSNGLQTIQCDKINGKNSVDLKIAVDITCFSYEKPHVNIYFIVTTDSDYRQVIFPLREKNKIVYGIGYSDVNKSLTSICDKYIKIENLRKDEINKTDIDKYWSIIKNCISDKGIRNIGRIKEQILLQYPTFDEKEYNERRFSQFLSKYYKKKIRFNNDNVELI